MRLFREISLASSTFLVIGNIVGVGIFTTSGLIAAQLGSTVWLVGVWVLGGALALIGACCYALLARQNPRAGGEYAFLYPAFGPLPAFLSGWASLLIGFSAPIAASALGLAHYLKVYLPEAMAGSPWVIKGVALSAVLAVSVFLSLGLRFGAQLHSLVTLLNVGLLAGFSWVSLYFSPVSENLPPHFEQPLLAVDFSALGSAIILVMFSYSGWNAAAYVAEEIRSPRRNIPASLILGTLAVMGAYVTVNLAYFAAVPLQALSGKIAVAEIAASAVLGPSGANFLNLLILSSILSSLTAMSIAGPRVYFAMARDGYFPAWLGHVNEKRKLPLRSIWFQSGIALVLITVGDFQQILLSAGVILVLFSTLTVSAIFRTPRNGRGVAKYWFFYRLLPAVFVAINGLVLLNAPFTHPKETLAGILVVLGGLPVYWYYHRRRGPTLASREAQG